MFLIFFSVLQNDNQIDKKMSEVVFQNLYENNGTPLMTSLLGYSTLIQVCGTPIVSHKIFENSPKKDEEINTIQNKDILNNFFRWKIFQLL